MHILALKMNYNVFTIYSKITKTLLGLEFTVPLYQLKIVKTIVNLLQEYDSIIVTTRIILT